MESLQICVDTLDLNRGIIEEKLLKSLINFKEMTLKKVGKVTLLVECQIHCLEKLVTVMKNFTSLMQHFLAWYKSHAEVEEVKEPVNKFSRVAEKESMTLHHNWSDEDLTINVNSNHDVERRISSLHSHLTQMLAAMKHTILELSKSGVMVLHVNNTANEEELNNNGCDEAFCNFSILYSGDNVVKVKNVDLGELNGQGVQYGLVVDSLLRQMPEIVAK